MTVTWAPQVRERCSTGLRQGGGKPTTDTDLFLQDGDHAEARGECGPSVSVVLWQWRRWGCVVAACSCCVLWWGLIWSIRGYDNVSLLVTMVSVARLKRLVQGLTLVAATAYTTLLLYQSVSTTVASSTLRLPLRQQVRFVFILSDYV